MEGEGRREREGMEEKERECRDDGRRGQERERRYGRKGKGRIVKENAWKEIEGKRRREKEREGKRRREKEREGEIMERCGWRGRGKENDGEGQERKMEREGNVRRGKGGSMIHLFIIFYSPIHLYHHKLELNSIHF